MACMKFSFLSKPFLFSAKNIFRTLYYAKKKIPHLSIFFPKMEIAYNGSRREKRCLLNQDLPEAIKYNIIY